MIYIEELKIDTSQKEQTRIGRQLLLRGLQMEHGITELPAISLGLFGKPFFPDYPGIHFNISHCRRAVVCIISDKNVGIDVECIDQFDQDLAQYISNPREFETIINSGNPALAFTICWTRKESYCKLTGKGLDTRKEIQNILINNTAIFHTIIKEKDSLGEAGCIISYCHF